MNANLCKVDISDWYFVCARYVMKRIGYEGDLKSFLKEPMIPYDGHEQIGDIFVWKNKEAPSLDNTMTILEKQAITITTPFSYPYHYAVVEGTYPTMYSDCVYNGNGPYIRVRFVNMKSNPDYIIRVNHDG